MGFGDGFPCEKMKHAVRTPRARTGGGRGWGAVMRVPLVSSGRRGREPADCPWPPLVAGRPYAEAAGRGALDLDFFGLKWQGLDGRRCLALFPFGGAGSR